jgi:hypothetical protein
MQVLLLLLAVAVIVIGSVLFLVISALVTWQFFFCCISHLCCKPENQNKYVCFPHGYTISIRLLGLVGNGDIESAKGKTIFVVPWFIYLFFSVLLILCSYLLNFQLNPLELISFSPFLFSFSFSRLLLKSITH